MYSIAAGPFDIFLGPIASHITVDASCGHTSVLWHAPAALLWEAVIAKTNVGAELLQLHLKGPWLGLGLTENHCREP